MRPRKVTEAKTERIVRAEERRKMAAFLDGGSCTAFRPVLVVREIIEALARGEAPWEEVKAQANTSVDAKRKATTLQPMTLEEAGAELAGLRTQSKPLQVIMTEQNLEETLAAWRNVANERLDANNPPAPWEKAVKEAEKTILHYPHSADAVRQIQNALRELRRSLAALHEGITRVGDLSGG